MYLWPIIKWPGIQYYSILISILNIVLFYTMINDYYFSIIVIVVLYFYYFHLTHYWNIHKLY